MNLSKNIRDGQTLDEYFELGLKSLAFDAAKRHLGDQHALLDVDRTKPPSLSKAVTLHSTSATVYVVTTAGEHVRVLVTYTGVCTSLPADDECDDTIDLEAEYRELRAAGHDDGRARELMGQVA